MTNSSTLNSRIRVLVAKAFRAEKLYSSIRNSSAEQAAGVGQIAELCNDVRAREWEKNHSRLRAGLNDLLQRASQSVSAQTALAHDVTYLRDMFRERSEESRRQLEEATIAAVDLFKRQEFGTLVKSSVDLVRHKARIQACDAIADELSAALGASGSIASPRAKDASRSGALDSGLPGVVADVLEDLSPTQRSQKGRSTRRSDDVLYESGEVHTDRHADALTGPGHSSNVIPFQRPATASLRYNRV